MKSFEEKIINSAGDDGRRWLTSLPILINAAAKKWHLTEIQPVTHLSYNYVLSAVQKGTTSVILKFSLDAQHIQHEAFVLQEYAGQGCVQLLDMDLDLRVLLLERALPGKSLTDLFPQADEQALYYAVEVMRQLHAVKMNGSLVRPTIQDWLEALYSVPSTVAFKEHVDKAQKQTNILLESVDTPVLLHGDLHHDNILSSNRGWLAIDPKGVIGEPAYEVGAFIRNPIPYLLKTPNVSHIISQRLKLFAKLLQLDTDRVRMWSYVQAVLAACWAQQDAEDTQGFIAIAELIDAL